MRIFWNTLVFAGVTLLTVRAGAVEYGGIDFPQGEASFADAVVSLEYAEKAGVEAPYDDGTQALGPPDVGDDEGWVSLGNAPDEETINELIVSFEDNRLVNVEGDDLYIFEIGPQVEATDVAVSRDGETWVEFGRVEGSTRALDLADVDVPDDAEFQYVRLRDFPDGDTSGGPFAGPDIDAIGAIGSVVKTVSPVCQPPETDPVDYGETSFPYGDLSFADRVVAYEPGAEVSGEHLEASRALGPPDELNVALGIETEEVAGGTLTLFFGDNAFTDEPGIDLYVFEGGPTTEATFVDVSVDGSEWHELGRVAGATSAVDLADSDGLPESALYRYVRLRTDPNEQKTGAPFAGPDIDAVGAISSCRPLETVDEDDDGVPDGVAEADGGDPVPSDLDGDGTPDATDACPMDPDVSDEDPDATGEDCDWGEAGADDDLIDLEGCGCASGSGPGGGGLLFVVLTGLMFASRLRRWPARGS